MKSTLKLFSRIDEGRLFCVHGSTIKFCESIDTPKVVKKKIVTLNSLRLVGRGSLFFRANDSTGLFGECSSRRNFNLRNRLNGRCRFSSTVNGSSICW